MNKKLFIIPALAITTIAGVVSVRSVAAQATDNQQLSIIQKLATKFGLNEAEVKAVFDADRAERQAAREKEFTDLLNQAVKDGKLSENQKQLILTKHAELKSKHESEMASRIDPSTMTDAERQAKMVARRAEMDSLKSWADQNNIDLKYFMMGRQFGHMGKGNFAP